MHEAMVKHHILLLLGISKMLASSHLYNAYIQHRSLPEKVEEEKQIHAEMPLNGIRKTLPIEHKSNLYL